jgi:hypothetical protein
MPKPASKPPRLKAVQSGPSTARDLAWIGDVPASTRDEVRSLAEHVLEAGGVLSPADALQLTEYGRVAAELRDAEELREVALAAGDVKAWLALGRKMDTSRAALRGLLRDLRLTRNAAASSDTKAAARKLAERGGTDWSGIL